MPGLGFYAAKHFSCEELARVAHVKELTSLTDQTESLVSLAVESSETAADSHQP